MPSNLCVQAGVDYDAERLVVFLINSFTILSVIQIFYILQEYFHVQNARQAIALVS